MLPEKFWADHIGWKFYDFCSKFGELEKSSGLKRFGREICQEDKINKIGQFWKILTGHEDYKGWKKFNSAQKFGHFGKISCSKNLGISGILSCLIISGTS